MEIARKFLSPFAEIPLSLFHYCRLHYLLGWKIANWLHRNRKHAWLKTPVDEYFRASEAIKRTLCIAPSFVTPQTDLKFSDLNWRRLSLFPFDVVLVEGETKAVVKYASSTTNLFSDSAVTLGPQTPILRRKIYRVVPNTMPLPNCMYMTYARREDQLVAFKIVVETQVVELSLAELGEFLLSYQHLYGRRRNQNGPLNEC